MTRQKRIEILVITLAEATLSSLVAITLVTKCRYIVIVDPSCQVIMFIFQVLFMKHNLNRIELDAYFFIQSAISYCIASGPGIILLSDRIKLGVYSMEKCSF